MLIGKLGDIEMWLVNNYYLVIGPGKFRQLARYDQAFEYYLQLAGE